MVITAKYLNLSIINYYKDINMLLVYCGLKPAVFASMSYQVKQSFTGISRNAVSAILQNQSFACTGEVTLHHVQENKLTIYRRLKSAVCSPCISSL